VNTGRTLIDYRRSVAASPDHERVGTIREGTRRMGDAAFFDLDNTLIKGSALFHLGAGMVGHRLVTRREISRHARRHLAYRWRGERAQHVTDMRDRALTLGAGLSVDRVVALSEQVYDDRLVHRLWIETVRLAQRHLELGDPVWLVTAAPVELARIVAERLGFSGALGTEAEVRDGHWTGRLAGAVLHGQAKADAVGTLAGRHRFRLETCAAYSDSINDLPLLETVGRPHAVNPDRELARIARQRDWPVYDFRATRRALRLGRPNAAAVIASGS
jgi:HAD superfamily hydrolase (TIGR01490 family)